MPVKTGDGVSMSAEKLIISTAASRGEALRIAKALVEESLVACVNVTGPIDSVYRWQGNVENAQEFLLLIKTTSSKAANAIARLRELHSYEVPEAIELDIEGGNADYLRWIRESV
jgi:periplasmic divalent cation tolerance protein